MDELYDDCENPEEYFSDTEVENVDIDEEDFDRIQDILDCKEDMTEYISSQALPLCEFITVEKIAEFMTIIQDT